MAGFLAAVAVDRADEGEAGQGTDPLLWVAGDEPADVSTVVGGRWGRPTSPPLVG